MMDLCASESEGRQAIQQLQSDPLTRSIRVLALTASGDTNSLMRARAADAAEAVPKLPDFDLLQRRTTMLLGVQPAR
jgi:CheY-like chemotaxis protein